MNNTIADLDFRRADPGLFSFPQETALEGRGAQESWLIFKTASLEHKNGPFPCAGSMATWLNMELLTELTHIKEVHRRWKQGEAVWEEYSPCMKEQSEEGQSSASVENSKGGEGQQERLL